MVDTPLVVSLVCKDVDCLGDFGEWSDWKKVLVAVVIVGYCSYDFHVVEEEED